MQLAIGCDVFRVLGRPGASLTSTAHVEKFDMCSHAALFQVFGIMATISSAYQHCDTKVPFCGQNRSHLEQTCLHARLTKTSAGTSACSILDESANSNNTVPSSQIPHIVRRRISCPTGLRCLYVTQQMVACLDLHLDRFQLAPQVLGPDQPCTERATTSAQLRQFGTELSLNNPNRLPFRHDIRLRDSTGRSWPVTYESTSTSRQHHPRLTRGWRAFCQRHKVRAGDSIEFRRCMRWEGYVVHVRVLGRGAGGSLKAS